MRSRACFGLVVALGLCHAAGAADRPPFRIESWLVLGPVSHPLPAFHDAERGGVDPDKLLEAEILPRGLQAPRDGLEVPWFSGAPLRWTARDAGRKGRLTLERPAGGGEHPALAWVAAWVVSERWQALEIELVGAHRRRCWVDGSAVAQGKGEEVKGKVDLTPGKHLLVVQTLLDPQLEEEWTIGASFLASAPLSASLSPSRQVALQDITDPPHVTSLAVSPDGRLVATIVERIVPGTHDAESWIELRETQGGALHATWRGGSGLGQVAWSPDGRWVSYAATLASSDDKKKPSTLFLYDRQTARSIPLLESVDRLSGHVWSPTARAIVYWTEVPGEEFKDGLKRLEGLQDRWSSYRNKQHLHLVTVPGGARRQLTAGNLSASAQAFSPGGDKLLFSRQVEHPAERPYSRSELWELDLGDFSSRKLRDFAWLDGVSYAPDGARLLVRAQPSEFERLGVAVAEGVVPNSYDSQLFLWEPESGAVDPITRDFAPSVLGAVWSRADGRIYVTAEDRDHRRLFRYDPEARRFEALEVGLDVVDKVDLAWNAPRAVGLGDSPWVPEKLFAVDLASGRAVRLEHPGDSWFADVGGGSVEAWSFTTTGGRSIDGRVYLPPDFDARRKYPLIVYYYGGTSPTERSFGGRYPKEWWAASGYVVYTLQPSGATGFGQEFSAAHVNDWGRTASEEILEGTRKFLDAHPYVDRERVGCIGASFGGFMTMLLATRTELFAAAVSHAGISSIASYWGEGYWGYSYNSVAAADSFPWNRRELYVDQSPLFRADQVRVPILLTHGTADTNVPVGESDAFYVALKLLERPVEYLQFQGEDHRIRAHAKRQLWAGAIMAWFDRWLKDQPEWWDKVAGRVSQDGSSQP
jgi:dipeptidyl aminopeptidase/acylaminoacyl peptidase